MKKNITVAQEISARMTAMEIMLQFSAMPSSRHFRAARKQIIDGLLAAYGIDDSGQSIWTGKGE